MVPCFYLPGVVDKGRNQYWACFRLLFEAHGRFTPCKWPLIRCIKTVLFRRIPQSTIKVHTIFPSDESSNASQIQLYNNTPQTEKRPVLASPHPHQKANLRIADDQVTWCHVFLIRGFLFHGLICKLIYRFIDFPTEPDARNAQKGSVLSTAGGESTRRSRNSRQNQEVKWPSCEGYVFCGLIDEKQEGNSEKKTIKSCFDVVTLHVIERFGTSNIWKKSKSSKIT